MKKFILFALCLTFLASASLFMVGCKNKNKHTHSFTVETVADKYLLSAATCTQKATYFYSCKCGEKGSETFEYGDELGHSFTNYVSGNDATCTRDGTKTAKCDRCDETDTIADVGSKLGHSFTDYKSNHDATCTEDGTKTATCDRCDEIDTVADTGSKLGHSFTNYVSDNNATCTEDGTKTAKCDRCDETDTITDEGSKLGHSFTNYVSDNNATYEKDGTKTAHCDHKGCTATDTITDEGTKLESYMAFKTLLVNGDKVYGKVSNDTKTFSFINEIEAVGLIKYFVSFDIYGNQKIDTKTIPLNVGDNTVYVTELLDGEPKATFEVTIRRRPMYTVSFDTNGGSDVESQQVEEDTIISAPITTRLGYTFVKWSYDFSQPIIEDVNITAKWEANIDTLYKVEYYFENFENNDYTLYETDDLQGITDTTATANIKTYDHFTFNKNRGVLSGNISCDGSLILKVFYTRNTYTLSNANTSYGIITNATTVKYGSNIESVVTEYLGCEFIGWFNGEELLSSEKEYLFTAEYNVTAKFKVKDEMLNFNFNSSVDTCKITGLKDKTISEIVIPEYVTSIEDSAFYNCSGLTSITIGNRVTSISHKAFYNCSGLTSIEIPDSVTSIGWDAFYGCSLLESITLPFIGASKTAGNGYEQVFGYIFGYKTTSSYGSSVSGAIYQYYGSNKYYHYYIPSSLKTVILSNSVTSIGYSAFYGCSKLTSITIGNRVTSIGRKAFEGCSGLTSITIPNSVTSIGENALAYCSGLTSITIPYSVTSIGNWAFYNCSGLTRVIWNAENCTSAGDDYPIFRGCSNLSNVTIGDNVKIIPSCAFYACSGLTSITIPYSVTSIGNWAFYNCSGLKSVIWNAENCTSVGSYKDNRDYTIFKGCSNLSNVTIGDNVKAIPSYAFYNCSGLKSVTIPNSVTSIGDYAFSWCSGLTNVIIGNSVTSIGEEAFSWCSGLTNLIIGNSVTSIKDRAFIGCSRVTSITIHNSVTSIGENAFYNCSGLTSVTIPNSVTSIGDSAFEKCENLTSIYFKGTSEQWNAIKKGSCWNYNTGSYTVYCTDKNIK